MKLRLALSSSLALALCASACTTPANQQPDAVTDGGTPDAIGTTDAAELDASMDGNSDVPPVEQDVPTMATDVPLPWIGSYVPGPRATAPAGFFWGSATAGYQVEGRLENTDWYQWEQSGHIVNNDHANDGPQSLTNFMADVQSLRDSGQNSYRLGIEMARVFPTRASWDACRNAMGTRDAKQRACRAAADMNGLQYYHNVLRALRMANITPMVTVHHWVMPDYLADLRMPAQTQGWMNERMRTEMPIYAGFLAFEFGDDVDWWITLNEPLVLVLAGYLDGRFPPGRSLDFDGATTVMRNLIYAHAGMYDAIKANDTTVANAGGPIAPAQAANVSIAHHIRRFFPANPASRNDVLAAQKADWLNHKLFIEAITRGNLDSDGDGTVSMGEPMNDPALRNRLDFLGINYYGITTFRANAAIPLIGGLPVPEERDRGLPKTDFGWDVYARGLEDIITTYGTDYRLPIIITENGLADASDQNRPRYLLEHIGAMLASMQRGTRVLGYYHWSLIDNFEWVSGYCPKFGLFSVDRNDPMRRRTARPSAMLYRDVIRAGTITDAQLMNAPAYRAPMQVCASTVTAGGNDGGVRDGG